MAKQVFEKHVQSVCNWVDYLGFVRRTGFCGQYDVKGGRRLFDR
jgi:hypothetical protein